MRKRPTIDRLLEKIAVDAGTDCWLWTARRDRHGYAKVNHNGRMQLAHRVAFELLVGPIPDGMDLDHLCRVRHCVNPGHLEPVTRRENMLRGTSPVAARARQIACVHGHPFTPENTNANPKFGRKCRTCDRERARARRLRGAKR